MNQGAWPYGEALWQLSVEKNCTEEIFKACTIIRKAFNQSKDYNQILKTPLISAKEKKKALEEWLHAAPLLLQDTAYLLCSKNKAYLLFDVLLVYKNIYLENNDMISATVVSAMPLSDELLVKIQHVLESKTNKILDVENDVDPECIGGLNILMQGKQYDATIQTQLNKIYAMLLEAKR